MSRRGSILLAVLVVLALGSLGAMTVVLSTDAEDSAAGLAHERDRVRALARSGLRAVMGELSAQRDELLRGGSPELTGSWTLFTDELGRQGMIRLVDLAPEDSERLAIAETSRLDLNSATPEMLARLPGINGALAERIVASGPFASVAELLRVRGVTPELLYGRSPIAADRSGIGGSSAQLGVESSGDSLGLGSGAQQALASEDDSEGIAALLTVFSFDPNVQMGLVEPSARGDLRINLNRGWSEALGRAVTERFNAEAARFLEMVMLAGVSFESDADIVAQLMRLQGDEYRRWINALDTFTTTDDHFRPGRVDLNRASPVVLAALPGLDPGAAAAIVAARDELEEEVRRRVTWPLERGLLSAEAFRDAIGFLTTRSLQWRVRIEVGLLPGEAAEELSPELAREVPLDHALVLDAVVDVASQRPRIAYLRDVSLLGEARRVVAERAALEQEMGGGGQRPLSEHADGIDFVTVEDADVAGADRRGFPFSRPVTPEAPARPAESVLPAESAEAVSSPSPPSEPVDRRIGRWTTRQREMPDATRLGSAGSQPARQSGR